MRAGNAGSVGTELYTIDKTGPTVIGTQPATDAVDVPVNSVINATFSEAMNISSINTDTFQLLGDGSVTPVVGTLSFSVDNTTAKFKPTSDLVTSPGYTATIKGAPNGVKDKAGNLLAADDSWHFFTPATITGSLNTSSGSVKWGHAVNLTGVVTNARPGDTISADFGDNTTPTPISSIPADGKYSAIHTYDSSAGFTYTKEGSG